MVAVTAEPAAAAGTWAVVGGTGASADAGPLELNVSIIRNETNGRCLDSNAAGQVYTLPCSGSSNPYQTWEVWNGGWTRNVATRLCLQLHQPGQLDYRLSTGGCWAGALQYWRHWNGGWFQSFVIDRYTREKLCLQSAASPFDRTPETYRLAHKCEWGDVEMHWRADFDR